MGKNNQVIEARSGKNYVFEPTNKHFCASFSKVTFAIQQWNKFMLCILNVFIFFKFYLYLNLNFYH